jgi:hypothetical protein
MSGDAWAALEFDPLAEGPHRETVRYRGVTLRLGDRVLLAPRGRADIFDMVLAGRTATIEAIEVDYEDHVHLAVLVDDDPGRDLGVIRQPGHRFFFALDDVEPLGEPGLEEPS